MTARMTTRSAKGNDAHVMREPTMIMTTAARDDAWAAQHEHDQQQEQYERATRKRRRAQTTTTTAAATATATLQRDHDDGDVSDDTDTRDEEVPSEDTRARASAAARTQDVDDYIAANRNPNTHAAYTSTYRQFMRWARDVEDSRRSAAAAIDVDRPSATDIALISAARPA